MLDRAKQDISVTYTISVGGGHHMSSSLDDSHPEAIGEKVLTTAVANARDAWGGERLVAAYALGSLAHGGFSIHVSDVDLGLILSDPLADQDTEEMASISDAIKASGAPLADRLSVFWGSIATLSGEAPGGRFPPLDRLDLIQYGRLLAGRDIREQLPSPGVKDLVVVGAEFALRLLSKPDDVAKLKDWEPLPPVISEHLPSWSSSRFASSSRQARARSG